MEGKWSMANETEKLTINLGVVESAQIDVLVEQGIYSNRSDFIRSAVRNHLKDYSEKIEQQLIPIASRKHWEKTIGIAVITKKWLEEWSASVNKDMLALGINIHSKLNFSVIGMLVFDKDISEELFRDTVANVLIRGKLVASPEIKKIISELSAK
jgi:Arc/MetJ-type ribon-helix-helix transcriptional regulator